MVFGVVTYWLTSVLLFGIMPGIPGLEWLFTLLFALLPLWCAWFGLHCLLVSFAVHSFYRHEYDYTARLLVSGQLGPALAEEEHWRPLYAFRRRLTGQPKFPEMSRTLETHICFCACFLESLRDLSCGPGKRLRRFYILQGFSRRQIASADSRVKLLLPFALAITAGWLRIFIEGYPSLFSVAQLGGRQVPVWSYALAPALGVWLFIAALIGPLELLMRARKAALCDFLLGRLEVDEVRYATPPGEEGWWLRRWYVNRLERKLSVFRGPSS